MVLSRFLSVVECSIYRKKFFISVLTSKRLLYRQCACLYVYFISFFTAHLLYHCDDNTECSDLWHSRCSYDGRCICKLNNIAINNSTCLPTLDGYCWRNDQCMPENSACIHYRCSCKSNFIVVAGNMCVSP